jgi:hypothetical protein
MQLLGVQALAGDERQQLVLLQELAEMARLSKELEEQLEVRGLEDERQQMWNRRRDLMQYIAKNQSSLFSTPENTVHQQPAPDLARLEAALHKLDESRKECEAQLSRLPGFGDNRVASAEALLAELQRLLQHCKSFEVAFRERYASWLCSSQSPPPCIGLGPAVHSLLEHQKRFHGLLSSVRQIREAIACIPAGC